MEDSDLVLLGIAAVGAYFVVKKLTPNVKDAVTSAGLGSPQATQAYALQNRKDAVTSKLPNDSGAGFVYEVNTTYRVTEKDVADMSPYQRGLYDRGVPISEIATQNIYSWAAYANPFVGAPLSVANVIAGWFK